VEGAAKDQLGIEPKMTQRILLEKLMTVSQQYMISELRRLTGCQPHHRNGVNMPLSF
jgi:hypothetical protein